MSSNKSSNKIGWLDLIHSLACRLYGPLPHSFVKAVFAQAAREDLAQYHVQELAYLAHVSYAHLCAPRSVGQHSVKVFVPCDPLETGEVEKQTEHAPLPLSEASQKVLQKSLNLPGNLNDVMIIQIVNDDQPFLVDSTLAELTEEGYEIRLVAHPIFGVKRNGQGEWIGFDPEDLLSSSQVQAEDGKGDGALRVRESFIHIHVNRSTEEEAPQKLKHTLENIYKEVRVATRDWRKMQARTREAIESLQKHSDSFPAGEVEEATEFLQWLIDDHFTFLGIREYLLTKKTSERSAKVSDFLSEEKKDVYGYTCSIVEGSGLGILSDSSLKVLRRSGELIPSVPEIAEFLDEPHILLIAKANVKARVHRAVHMDYIGIKLFDEKKELIGEIRLVGLFTSSVYTGSATDIPYIRHKITRVLEEAKYDQSSFLEKLCGQF